jgi:hypothetical protein
LIAPADDDAGSAAAGEQAGDGFAQPLGAAGNDGKLSGDWKSRVSLGYVEVMARLSAAVGGYTTFKQ